MGKYSFKIFLSSTGIDEARIITSKFGSEIYNENWRRPGLIACIAMDPEGNVIQIRESTQ